MLKIWAHLNRQGIEVARCTVERLMRRNRWRGAARAAKVRTTIADPTAARAPDLVNRQFAVEAPNRLLVAGFTYMRLATGAFAYTAFVIDAYACMIVGWECSASKHTAFVERGVRQAVTLRVREGKPLQNKAIHHSDAGSQGEFQWSSQYLDQEVSRGVTSKISQRPADVADRAVPGHWEGDCATRSCSNLSGLTGWRGG